jgi:lipid A 3-O-deacylase
MLHKVKRLKLLPMKQPAKYFWNVFTGLLLLVTYANYTNAQPVNEKHSLRILWDNDFINVRGDGTDRYYTNGMRIDYFYTKKQKAKFPSSLLLNISDDNNNIYGWGLAQFMFTPRNIAVPDIQYNDRPYAGALYSIHSLQSIDKNKKIKVTSEIGLGVIGPLSFAKETQTWAHRVINYTKPEGWHNQVPNDIILNYNISIEKQILQPSKNLLVVGIIETFSGTTYNAAGAGFMLRVGKFNNYFDNISLSQKNNKSKSQLYVFMKPAIRVVLSNALLQGGLINQISPQNTGYVLSKDQIERLIVLYDVGVTFERPKYSVTITQKFIGAEFKGQYTQEFGNFTMHFKL